MRRRLGAGWQHLYLFTWLEATSGQAAGEAPPEVEVGPIWLEDESPPYAPTTARPTVLPDPELVGWFEQAEAIDASHTQQLTA